MQTTLDIQTLRDRGLILLEVISGSHAYGLATPTSDIDRKGVFILPKEEFYGLNYIPQVSDEKNDEVFYELRRFMELLSVNNPNILEMLNSPEDVVVSRHPFLASIDHTRILSKLCRNTFGKFALSQIRKAKGLNKKIVNPIPKERKGVLDFCYVNHGAGSIKVKRFLEMHRARQEDCGLVKIPHMLGMYGLYIGAGKGYKGLVQKESSNDISLSSIPKGEEQAAILYFNKDGYSLYCKEYREYWDWVEKRNDARYASTQSHGKNYDAKNMMHTFRLLEMAIEVGQGKGVNVRRINRDFLLGIKSGSYEYDELVQMANEKQAEMEEVFASSKLRETPDLAYINRLAFEIREEVYNTPESK